MITEETGVYKVKTIAAYLGVSERTIRNHIAIRRLDVRSIGSQFRVPASSVRVLMQLDDDKPIPIPDAQTESQSEPTTESEPEDNHQKKEAKEISDDTKRTDSAAAKRDKKAAKTAGR